MRYEFNLWVVGKNPWKRKWPPTPWNLAWKIPWAEKPDRLQSIGLQRFGHSEHTPYILEWISFPFFLHSHLFLSLPASWPASQSIILLPVMLILLNFQRISWSLLLYLTQLFFLLPLFFIITHPTLILLLSYHSILSINVNFLQQIFSLI